MELLTPSTRLCCVHVSKMIKHAYDTATLVIDVDADAFYASFVLAGNIPQSDFNSGAGLNAAVMALEHKPPNMSDRTTVAGYRALTLWERDLSWREHIQASPSEDAQLHHFSLTAADRAIPTAC